MKSMSKHKNTIKKPRKNRINPLKYSIVYILILSLFFIRCNKKNDAALINNISSGTSLTLRQIQFLDNGIGYIVGGKLYETSILLKTIDSGNTWKIIDSSIVGGGFGMNFINADTGLITSWPSSVYKTIDGGKTFTKYITQFDQIVRSPLFISNDKCMAVSGIGYEDGKFWKSDDGGLNWKTDSFKRALNKLIMKNSRDGFIASYGLILKSTDGGTTWNSTDSKGDNWMDIDFPTNQTGYAIGFEGKIIKTIDDGMSWKTIQSGNNIIQRPDQLNSAYFYNEIVGAVVGYDGTLKITTNGGYDWTYINTLTKEHLRDVYLFNKNSGIVIGENGTIFKFQL